MKCSEVLQCSDWLSNKVFNIISRHTDNMKLLLICILLLSLYTGCNRRNGPNFGRVFLRSNYTDITQNIYIQSRTVTEILAREKSGLLWCLRTVLVGNIVLPPLLEMNAYVIVRCSASDLDNGQASKSV